MSKRSILFRLRLLLGVLIWTTIMMPASLWAAPASSSAEKTPPASSANSEPPKPSQPSIKQPAVPTPTPTLSLQNTTPSSSSHSTAADEATYGPYMAQLQKRIKRNWHPPQGEQSLRTKISFRIARDGRLIGTPSIITSSGSARADRAARQAIQLSSPFAPLPAKHRDMDLAIEFTFDYNVYRGGTGSPPQSSPSEQAAEHAENPPSDHVSPAAEVLKLAPLSVEQPQAERLAQEQAEQHLSQQLAYQPYIQQVRSLIQKNWRPPATSAIEKPPPFAIVIRVLSDGKIRRIDLKTGSPNDVLFRAAVQAIVTPLPYPPIPHELLEVIQQSYVDILLPFN